MKKIKTLITAILFMILMHNTLYALEVATHKAINFTIAEGTYNGFSLDSYLKTNLGLTSGIKEILSENNNVQRWLELGGHYEDKPPWTIPYRRSFNHYHNPLTNKGYLGIWNSSAQWALMLPNTQSPGGYYSWADVRNYYFKALTSGSKTARDTNFAETFRGIGQLMHLVHDASVPAHARDDAHVAYNYENFAESFVNGQGVPTPTAANFFNGVVTNIASFIDTNQYNGTNPSASNAIGLSEYTNVNFFSEDTINAGNFPYPKISDTTTTIVTRDFTGMFGIVYPRQYYLKKCCGETNNEKGYLLSTVDFLHDYRMALYPNMTQPEIPILDDNVYSDYASLLLPRAVGYSAGLLNYFFRGKIDMIKDPNNSSQYIIKNESNQKMEGTFSLYYDATAGNRHPVQDATWNLSINANGQSASVSFTEPTDAKEKGKYILVFQGTLGNESGAVVGRVVKLKEKISHAFVIQEEVIAENLLENTYYYNTQFAYIGSGCKSFYDPSNDGGGCYYVLVQEYRQYRLAWKWWEKRTTSTGRIVNYGDIKSIKADGYGIEFSINGQLIPNNQWMPDTADVAAVQWEIKGYCPTYITITFADGIQIMHQLFQYGVNGPVRVRSIEAQLPYMHEWGAVESATFETLTGRYVDIGGDQLRISKGCLSESNCYYDSNSGGSRYALLNKSIPYTIKNIGSFASLPLCSWIGSFDYRCIYEEGSRATWTMNFGPANKVSTTLASQQYYSTVKLPDYPPPLTLEVDRTYSQEELNYLNQLGIDPVYYTIKFR